MKVQQVIDFLKKCNPEVEVKFQFEDDGYGACEYTDFYIEEIHKLGFKGEEGKFVKVVISS